LMEQTSVLNRGIQVKPNAHSFNTTRDDDDFVGRFSY
jgi:hypothetical protein